MRQHPQSLNAKSLRLISLSRNLNLPRQMNFCGICNMIFIHTGTIIADDGRPFRVQLTILSILLNISLTNPVADFLAWEKILQSLRKAFSQSSLDKLSQFPSDWPEAEVKG